MVLSQNGSGRRQSPQQRAGAQLLIAMPNHNGQYRSTTKVVQKRPQIRGFAYLLDATNVPMQGFLGKANL